MVAYVPRALGYVTESYTVFQFGNFDHNHKSDGFGPGSFSPVTVTVGDWSTFPAGLGPGGSITIPFTADVSGGAILCISWTPGHSDVEQFMVCYFDGLPVVNHVTGNEHSRAIPAIGPPTNDPSADPNTFLDPTQGGAFPDGEWSFVPEGPFWDAYYDEYFDVPAVGTEPQYHELKIEFVQGDGFGIDALYLEALPSVPTTPTKLGSCHWRYDETPGSAGVKYWYEDATGDSVADYLYLEFHVTYFVKENHTLWWLGYFELDDGFTSDGAFYDSPEEGNYKLIDVWAKTFKKGPYDGQWWWDNTIRERNGGFLWHGNCWGDGTKALHSFIFADIEPDGTDPQQGTVDLERGMKLLFTTVFRVPADFHTTITFNLGTYISGYGTSPCIIGSL